MDAYGAQQVPSYQAPTQKTFLGMGPMKRFGACFNCSLKTGVYFFSILQLLSGIGTLLMIIGCIAHGGHHGHHGGHHRGHHGHHREYSEETSTDSGEFAADDSYYSYEQYSEDKAVEASSWENHHHKSHHHHGHHRGHYDSDSYPTAGEYSDEGRHHGRHGHHQNEDNDIRDFLGLLFVVGIAMKLIAALFAIYGIKAARSLEARPAFTFYKFNKFVLYAGSILLFFAVLLVPEDDHPHHRHHHGRHHEQQEQQMQRHHGRAEEEEDEFGEEGGFIPAVIVTAIYFFVQGYVTRVAFSMAVHLENGNEGLVKFGPKFEEMLPYMQNYNASSHVQHHVQPTYPAQSIQLNPVYASTINPSPIVNGVYLQNGSEQQRVNAQTPVQVQSSIPAVSQSGNAVNVNNSTAATYQQPSNNQAGYGGYVAPVLPGFGNQQNNTSNNNQGNYPSF